MRGWLHLRIKYCFAQSLIEIWSDILQIKYEVKWSIYDICMLDCLSVHKVPRHLNTSPNNQNTGCQVASSHLLGDSIFIKLSSFRTAHDACAAQSSYQSCHLWRCILGASAAAGPFAQYSPDGQLWLYHYPSWQCPLQNKTGDELCILDQSNWHAHIAVQNSSETNPKHVQLGFDIFGLWTLAVDLLICCYRCAKQILCWSDPLWWGDPLIHLSISTHTRDDFIITSVNYSYPRATYLVCVSKKAAPPRVWWQGKLSFAWLQYILGYEVCLLMVLYPFVVAGWSHWSFALLGEDGARPNSEFIVFSLCVLC